MGGITGLRGRLIATVVIVAALGATAVAWTGVQRSTASLVDAYTRSYTDDVADRIGRTGPSVRYPSDDDALEQLRLAIGENVLVASADDRAASGVLAADADPFVAGLRDAMDADEPAGRVLTQRVEVGGRPWLVLGTPVMITAVDGSRSDSGIDVYAAYDLAPVQAQIDGLIRDAVVATLLVLPLAIVLALLASRRVLRPVARLRTTARRLAAGDLAARTEPSGRDELAQLTRTVNEMAASLQESMARMARMEEGSRRFAADVAHELRTPLAALTAAIEVLDGALADPAHTESAEARESAQLAVAETRRLVGLVEDVMEIARFDAGTVRPRLEQTDLVEVARACVRSRGWSDAVAIRGAPGGIRVRADRRRLDVIVANLVGNALKHGGPPVEVTVEAADGTAVLRVADSGPGIDEDALPHLFSRFYKADASRARTPGSGLGLAIARENALLHDGTIAAENRPGGGAVFTLRIPVDGRAGQEEAP